MLQNHKNYSTVIERIMIGILVGVVFVGIILGGVFQTTVTSISPYGGFEHTETVFNYVLMLYLWASGLIIEILLFIAFVIVRNQEILINNQIVLFGEGKPIETEKADDAETPENQIA